LSNPPEKYYIITYESLDDLMEDYMNLIEQFSNVEKVQEDVKTDVEINIGEDEYYLVISVWKI
jgi:hypothetical protein